MATHRATEVALHFESSGTGSDVVLIHGIGANLAFWYPHIVRDLTAAFHVTVYDLCGHGYSDMPASGYTSADMTRHLVSLLDSCHINAVHLIGHSFGGAIALHFGMLFPERVKTITLADAHIPALQPLPSKGAHAEWQPVRQRIQELGIEVTEEIPRVAYRFIEEMAQGTDNEQLSKGKAVHSFLNAWKDKSRLATRWRTLLRTTTALDDFANPAGLTVGAIEAVTTPVLAIYGQSSHCTPTCNRLAELLSDCTQIILPGVGHFHPRVRPHEFASYVRSFIECHNRS